MWCLRNIHMILPLQNESKVLTSANAVYSSSDSAWHNASWLNAHPAACAYKMVMHAHHTEFAEMSRPVMMHVMKMVVSLIHCDQIIG